MCLAGTALSAPAGAFIEARCEHSSTLYAGAMAAEQQFSLAAAPERPQDSGPGDRHSGHERDRRALRAAGEADPDPPVPCSGRCGIAGTAPDGMRPGRASYAVNLQPTNGAGSDRK